MKQACFYKTKSLHDKGNSECIATIKTCKFQLYSSYCWQNFIKTFCLLIFFSLSSSVILQAQSADQPSNYSESDAGSISNPYKITTLNNLYWITDQVNNQGNDFSGKYFKQTVDINASGTSSWFGGTGWVPILDSNTPTIFSGYYDGNNHVISGLYINDNSLTQFVGLFGAISNNGWIKNLGLTNLSITATGAQSVGGLVGDIYGTALVDNCYTTGSVTGNIQVGGLVGYDDNITGTSGTPSDLTVSNCYSSCTVVATNYAVGGLIGQTEHKITNCYATGNVSAGTTGINCGGLIGNNAGTVTSCFATGSSTGKNQTAGLIGTNDGTINYCYSTGNVIEADNSSGTNIGGFVGSNTGTISYCYAIDPVSANAFVSNKGGFVGSNTGTVNSNCYWNTDICSINNSLGTGKTTAEMKTSSLYSGWSSPWSIVNGSYPKLNWQAPAVASVSAPTSKTYKTSEALTFTVNFEQNVTVTGTPQLSLTLNTGGTVQASYTGGNGTSALTFSYTVQSGNQDNDGITVGSLSLNSGTIKSSNNIEADLTLAGVASTTGVLVDGVAPMVTSVSAPSNATYIVGQNLDFTVNFSEVVSVVTTGGTPSIALTLNTGGTVSATYLSGSGTSALVFRYTVVSGNADGDGVAVGSLSANGGTLKDAAGNNATLTLNSVGSTVNVLVDGVKPTATIAMSDAALRVGETSTVTFTFSEAVTGFSNADLTIFNGTLSAVSSGDGGITWTATFTPAASVTVATNVITLDNSGVTDAAGNAGSSSTTSPNYAIDTARPTAAIAMSDAAIKVGETATVTFTFSEAVTGFSNADLTIFNGTLTAVSSGDGGITWTATFTPAASVTVATNVITLDNSGVTDAAGNAGTSSTTSPNYAIDTARPTATITSTTAVITYATQIPVTVTFSEAVTGFISSDVTVTNGTVGSFLGSGATYTFSVTPSGQGLVTVAIAGSVAQDAAGNNNVAATSLSRTFDSVNPTLVVSTTASEPTNLTSIPVKLTFSEAVTGLVLSDFTVVNATLSALSGSGITYTLTATPTAQGTVSISLGSGMVLDVAQLGNVASNQLNRTFDNVAPTVSIASATATTTNESIIPVTITFSESVTGFMAGDLTVTNGTPSGFTGTGTTYTVNITPSGQGLVSVAVAAGVAQDAAGNLSTAATSLNRTFDNVAPTVSITSTAFSTTNVSPIPFTITFSESVTGFAVTDLSFINGTADGFTGSGTTYTVNIIPSGQGAVTVYVDVNVAADGAGNTNTVTAQLNRTFDTAPPTVSITSTSASVTNVSPIPVTITFNESVNYFDVTDLSLTNGTASDFNGSGSTYTVKITPSGQGAVVVNVAAGVATDGMGYANTAATPLTRTFDNVAPVISGVVNNGTYTSTQSPTFNEGTATLTKDNGTANAYTSGTAINATGSYVLTATDAVGNVATASFTITLSTGIDDERKPSLSVYPNPCTDGFKVSGIDAPANVTITDLTGRVVVTTMVDVDGDVPVNHLKQGTYLVKVNERVLKLIKK